ncbi:MAG TPA: MotA/TolQ/ExbB proton channel family protein [Opitutales bacterium]|nr:MotA/TolQ/ExbB proton channel family protein [Opitutales bacterium]
MSLRNPERGLFSVKGLIFSLGLVASFIFVGTIYGLVIRPEANKAALATSYGVDAGTSWSSFFVILKDYEQQICLSLFLWGIMILVYKFFLLQGEIKVVDEYEPEMLDEAEAETSPGGRSITREEAKTIAARVEHDSRKPGFHNKLLPYVVARGLERYHITGSVPEATETMMGRIEVASEQQESELSMLRYLVWAIPSIGFIGTVRGIGVALRRADEALQGDISGVTSALGVAFNSTLVALIISIMLMLLIHLLQSSQEGLILRLQTFCREQILDKLFEQNSGDRREETEDGSQESGVEPAEPAAPSKTKES